MVSVEGLTFGQILEKLLDESELFSREEWAEVLGFNVSTGTISDWVEGRSFPKPDHLYFVVETLKHSDVPDITLQLIAELMPSPINRFNQAPLPELPQLRGKVFPEQRTFEEYIKLPAFLSEEVVQSLTGG